MTKNDTGTVRLDFTAPVSIGAIAPSQRKVYGAVLIAPVIKVNGVALAPDADGMTRRKITLGQIPALRTLKPGSLTVTLPVAKRGRKPVQGQSLAEWLAPARPAHKAHSKIDQPIAE